MSASHPGTRLRRLLIVALAINLALPPSVWANMSEGDPPDPPSNGGGGNRPWEPPGLPGGDGGPSDPNDPPEGDEPEPPDGGDDDDGGPDGCSGGMSPGGAGLSSCDPCDEQCPPSQPPPADCPPDPPANTGDPVYLRYGAATEYATDITLPGPMGSWTHRRTYNSMDETRSVATSQGWGWTNNNEVNRLRDLGGGQISLLQDATSQAIFTDQGAGVYTAPEPTDLILTHSSGEFVLENVRTGEVNIFYDFAAGTQEEVRGRLKERTTRYWRGAEKIGWIYKYENPSELGELTSIMTPEGQEYLIDFEYTTAGQLEAIRVYTGPVNPADLITEVEYTYANPGSQHGGQNFSNDLGVDGGDGDLVQVKTRVRSSDGLTWTERYTQYRYDNEHRIEGIFRNDGIWRAVADNSTIDEAEDLLTKNNADTITTGRVLKDYASRWYEYYTGPSSTTAAGDVYGTNNLQSEYGGANTDESGMVKVGIDRPTGCSSCGGDGQSSGGASGIRYEYYYMELNGGTSTDWNDVVWIVVEDVVGSDGQAQKRSLWGINDFGRALRYVRIDDPSNSPKYWCTSKVFSTDPNHVGRLAERRMRSAHTVVNSSTLAATFLSGSDSMTLNQNDGIVWVYEYDNEGRRTSTLVKNGDNGPAHYTRHIEYDSLSETDQPSRVWNYRGQWPQSSNPEDVSAPSYFWQYAYTYHDNPATSQPDYSRIKTRTVTDPVVGTNENGSGIATEHSAYYDKEGRLRWTQDGEGYVNYYAYDPVSGRRAYRVRDVDASGMGGINTPTPGEWEAWSGGAPFTLPMTGDSLNLVTVQDHDTLGRLRRVTDEGGSDHYFAYEGDRTLQFPYWDGSGVGRPITAVVEDATGRVVENYRVSEEYDSFRTGADGGPVGFDTEPTQADDYVAHTRLGYDDSSGNLDEVRRYHDIVAGTGTEGSNYYGARLLYDAMGNRSGTARFVDTGVYQVNITVRDFLERRVQRWRGVSSTAVTAYPDMTNPPAYLKLVAETTYDGGGVGESFVTAMREYYGIASGEYIDTNYYRNYRGGLRGVGRENGGTAFGPYSVMDVDWLGRTTASASYSVEPNWATLTSGDGYGDYLPSNTADRINLTKRNYNDIGGMYRVERYPGTQSTDYLLTLSYFDRLGRPVATGDPHGVSTEYAYDGTGRQYQTRTVTQVDEGASVPYTGGVFNYNAPEPKLDHAAMTGGNEGVIDVLHMDYDDSGNVLSEHALEINHDDSDGLAIGSTSFVRSTTHHWYDEDRVTASADYGSGDAAAGPGIWKHVASAPARAGSAPSASGDEVILTEYEYDEAGRLSLTRTPGPGLNSAAKLSTKTFYDDLGRTRFLVEVWIPNYDPFAGPPPTGPGDRNRTTGWEYNGLGSVTELTAYQNNSADQTTQYLYEDDDDASLVTKTIYPDGDAASDNVTMIYALDGLVVSRTDQRNNVMLFGYDDARRLRFQGVESFGSATNESTRTITRGYDGFGRLTKVTSHVDSLVTDPDSTVGAINQIVYTYGDHGRVIKTEQDHDGPVVAGTTPAVQYAYSAATGNVYRDGLRMTSTTYPDSRVVSYGYGATDSIADRLSRAASVSDGGTTLATYEYNGVSRLVGTTLPEPTPDVHQLLYGATAGEYPDLDRFGRQLTSEWLAVTGGGPAKLVSLRYYYDAAGNRAARDREATLVTDTLDQEYKYDNLHRLKTMEQGRYDAGADNITLNRSKTQFWTLDSLGNWEYFGNDDDGNGNYAGGGDFIQNRTHSEANETETNAKLTGGAPAWVNPAHDAAGNMTTMPQPLAPDASYTAQYDAWNRLVKTDDGSGERVDYAYDGLHRRIDYDVEGSAPDDRHFYYNEQWQLLEERQSEAGTATEQYVWGPNYVDELVCRDRDEDGSSGNGLEERLYALHDALYNFVAITDTGGAVQERFHYDPYGKSEVLTPAFASRASTDYDWRYRYTGRRLDLDTGLQINRHRYYHNQLGRWISRDPIGYDGSLSNLYEAVISNPTALIDPLGLVPASSCSVQSLTLNTPLETNPLFNTIFTGPRYYDVQATIWCTCPDGSVTWSSSSTRTDRLLPVSGSKNDPRSRAKRWADLEAKRKQQDPKTCDDPDDPDEPEQPPNPNIGLPLPNFNCPSVPDYSLSAGPMTEVPQPPFPPILIMAPGPFSFGSGVFGLGGGAASAGAASSGAASSGFPPAAAAGAIPPF